MIDFNIPNEFVERTIQSKNEKGREWIEKLPNIILYCSKNWDLEFYSSFSKLTFNYTALVKNNSGRMLVLKICYPDSEVITEIEALQFFNGDGVIKILEVDVEKYAFLLEYIQPGDSLDTLHDDEQETVIASRIMKKLWKSLPNNHSFPSITDWEKGFDRMHKRFTSETNPLPSLLVDKGEQLFRELVMTMGVPVLLHGDLHHGNILQSANETWLAIDPKGVVGEKEYEIGAFLRNPISEILHYPNIKDIIRKRIDIFHYELGLDKERMYGWALAQTVLSAWWIIEDNGNDLDRAIAIAKMFDSL